ncbi:MAG TPA: hypothetical protein VFX86_03985 [Candidatus Saccharimonadales bacterium]|nr:hypothetical protein [Candidatus Saccharimonadales bacterium]
MFDRMRIIHHSHSGRFRPHEYTSYPILFLLIIVTGLTLTLCSVSAGPPPPEANSISLSGTFPKDPPKVAATIASPGGGQRFTSSPITIEGTCPKDTIVEIFKNNIFAGSTPCKDGRYSLRVDLLIGRNLIVARVFDVLNQAGPDSNKITVFYDQSGPQGAALVPLNFSGSQLLLNTDAVYRGVFPEDELDVPISIIGGEAPYAVNVQWGDLDNNIIPRKNNQVFRASHAYDKPGTYQITIQATDSRSRVAFLTVAAIVNGQTAATTVSGISKSSVNKLLLLWPFYTSAAAIVFSFWLGERREKRILTKNIVQHHSI